MSKKNIYLKYILALFIIISIFFLICYFFLLSKEANLSHQNNFILSKKVIDSKEYLNPLNSGAIPNHISIRQFNDSIIGYLSIPKIGLYNAPIECGTTSLVLSRAIGLFSHSNISYGNICLAAHNRSDTVDYFNQLWMLTAGDEMIIRTKEKISAYIVVFSDEILNSDWSYLKNTEEEWITCITCINNRPDKRLCVRAIKNKGGNN
ncbi:MAG: sortase [Clostridia bacterium]|nr:sortase [Clostridia bacterium]